MTLGAAEAFRTETASTAQANMKLGLRPRCRFRAGDLDHVGAGLPREPSTRRSGILDNAGARRDDGRVFIVVYRAGYGRRRSREERTSSLRTPPQSAASPPSAT